MKTYSGLLCFAAIREIRGFLATNVKVRLQREVPLSPDYGLSATEGSTRDSVEDDGPCKSLAELLLPAKDCKVDQMSGTDLAYIGDVVFELFVRSRNVWPSRRTSELQNIVVSTVRAEYQSELLEKLKNEFHLSDKEVQVLMRGRNAVTRSKNRRNPAAYQDSTSFEALVGYLYISKQERCTDLLRWLEANIDDLS